MWKILGNNYMIKIEVGTLKFRVCLHREPQSCLMSNGFFPLSNCHGEIFLKM